MKQPKNFKRTLLFKDGYGPNVGIEVKVPYLRKELNDLLERYNVRLVTHPFVQNEAIYFINANSCWVDGYEEYTV